MNPQIDGGRQSGIHSVSLNRLRRLREGLTAWGFPRTGHRNSTACGAVGLQPLAPLDPTPRESHAAHSHRHQLHAQPGKEKSSTDKLLGEVLDELKAHKVSGEIVRVASAT